MVAAWSVDRLGRSLTDLLDLLGELHAKGVDLYLHQQGLDTSTPGWPGDVPDDGRVRRVRARNDPGAGLGRTGAGKGTRQAPWASTDRGR